jgi:hypothetical protein
LSKLSRKTWMSRKDVIAYAIYRLAENEGILATNKAAGLNTGPHQRRK